jgi:hypothetical protein
MTQAEATHVASESTSENPGGNVVWGDKLKDWYGYVFHGKVGDNLQYIAVSSEFFRLQVIGKHIQPNSFPGADFDQVDATPLPNNKCLSFQVAGVTYYLAADGKNSKGRKCVKIQNTLPPGKGVPQNPSTWNAEECGHP